MGYLAQVGTFCWCTGLKDLLLLPHGLVVALPFQQIVPPLGGRILLLGVLAKKHGDKFAQSPHHAFQLFLDPC